MNCAVAMGPRPSWLQKSLPCPCFLFQDFLTGNSAVQALPRQHSQLYLDYVRRKQHEQAAHLVALVFVVVSHGRSRPRRSGLVGLPHELPAGLVQTHKVLH